jgi:autotransporter-associated beta strand protein
VRFLAGSGGFTGNLILNSGTMLFDGSNTGGTSSNALGVGLLTINGGSISGVGNSAGKVLQNSGQVWNSDWTYNNTLSNKTVEFGTGAISLGTTAGTNRTVTTAGTGATALLVLGGVISDGTTANSFTKAGSGNLRLTAANTYTGTTTVAEGTLQIGINNALPTSTALTLGSIGKSATLDLSSLGATNFNQQVAGLTTAGTAANQTVTNNSTGAGTATLTVNNDVATSNADFTFGGVIKDGATAKVALTKMGSKTFTLSGTNTYSGATTVSGGTLLVSGTLNSGSAVAVNGGTFNYTNGTALANAVTVAGGDFKYNSTQAYSGALTFTSGTISGSGNLSGTALTIGTGQTLSPGNSPGTLATGAETWVNGGSYNFQLLDASGIAGTGYDTLAITGGLNLSGLTAGGFDINLWTLSSIGPDVNGNALNFNGLSNYTWTLASTTTGITGFNAANFDIFTAANNGTSGFSNSFSGNFAVSTSGNNLILSYTAVPEPSTYAMVALGLGSLWLLRRKRSV